MGTPGPPATVPTPGQYYTVQPGDSLYEIAQEAYGTEGGSFAGSDASIQLIYKANKGVISDPAELTAGMVLYIPPKPSEQPTPGQNYTVKWGDSLSEIAQKAYGAANGSNASVQLIYNANKDVISDPAEIAPGMVLYIPPKPSGQPPGGH